MNDLTRLEWFFKFSEHHEPVFGDEGLYKSYIRFCCDTNCCDCYIAKKVSYESLCPVGAEDTEIGRGLIKIYEYKELKKTNPEYFL